MLSFILSSLKRLLFRETIDGKNYEVGGLVEHEEDERDFRFQDLGGVFDYQPKHEVHEIETLSVKDQFPLNTCVWNSYAAAREVDEGVILSPRSIVQYAAKNGYLRGNGFSSIREGQEVGRKFGIAEEVVVPNTMYDWPTYSSGLMDWRRMTENAANHRSESYFWVTSKNEVLKALDENRPIHTGADWYHSYNMSGGLRAPFILPWRKGVKVGGHAYFIKGYDLPRGLLKFQNSFGPGYGDKGCFYVRMSDWFREKIPGAVAVDLKQDDFKEFLRRYEGKDVRTVENPAIFRIENGVKRAYPDEITFYAWGGHFGDEKDRSFDYIASSILDRVPAGALLEAANSPHWKKVAAHWEQIKWLPSPDNTTFIQTLLK